MELLPEADSPQETTDTYTQESALSGPELYICILHRFVFGYRNRPLDTTFSKLQGGLLKNTPDGHRLLLQALAFICVAETGKRYTAVSISLSKGKSTLFVAQKGDVDSGIVPHLHDVWEKMKETNKDYRGKYPRNYTGPPDPDTADRLDDIRRTIFRFSLVRFRKNFEKHWPLFQSFLLAQQSDETFRILSPAFEKIHAILQNEVITDELLMEVFTALEAIFARLRDHFSDSDKAAQLKKLFKKCDEKRRGSTSIPPSPHRYLTKILAFWCHADIVTQLALSHEFAPFLSTPHDIIALPAALRTVNIRTSDKEVEFVIDCRLALIPHTDENGQLDRFFKYLCAKPIFEGYVNLSEAGDACSNSDLHCDVEVHPEIKLIAYHTHNPELVPLRFVGISKPPCYSCFRWIQAYNDCVVERYDTHPSHHGVEFPWVPPYLEFDRLRNRVRKETCQRVIGEIHERVQYVFGID